MCSSEATNGIYTVFSPPFRRRRAVLSVSVLESSLSALFLSAANIAGRLRQSRNGNTLVNILTKSIIKNLHTTFLICDEINMAFLAIMPAHKEASRKERLL